MKKLGWVVLATVSYSFMPGCGGVSKQDLESVKAELLAHDEQVKSQLKTELTELAKSVDERTNVATGNALKSLQFEEKMMSERLAELRSLIEELKKK